MVDGLDLQRGRFSISILGLLATILLAGPTTFLIAEVIAHIVPTHYPPLSAADAKTLADASANAQEPAPSWHGAVGIVAVGLMLIPVFAMTATVLSLHVAIPASIISAGITGLFWRRFCPSFLVPTVSGAVCAYVGMSISLSSSVESDMPLAQPLLWSSPLAGAAMGFLYYVIARRRPRR